MREKPRLGVKIGGTRPAAAVKMPREGARGGGRAEASRGEDVVVEGRGVKGRWGASGAGSPEGGGGLPVRAVRVQCDRSGAMRRGRTRDPGLRFVCGFAVRAGGMQCRGTERPGVAGDGRMWKRGEWREWLVGWKACIALVGCCPRGRTYAECRPKVTRKTGARCRSSLSVVREIRVTESDGRAPSGPLRAAAAFRRSLPPRPFAPPTAPASRGRCSDGPAAGCAGRAARTRQAAAPAPRPAGRDTAR